MTETIDTLTVINRALARIGSAPVMDLDEDSELAQQVHAVHEDLLDATLELYDWAWPRRTVKLAPLVDKPFGYTKAFQFPEKAVGGPIGLFPADSRRADPVRDFRVEGRTVAADAEQLWGTFRMRVDPADWPGAFRLAYTTWLAAQLAVPVTHDANLAQLLTQDAIGTPSEGGRGGLLGRAIAVDAGHAGGTAPLNSSDPLADAHAGGDGWSGGSSGW